MEKQVFNQTKNLVPKEMMHSSAGSIKIGRKAQALAFLAESTSIFTGDKLLTMLNLGISEDHRLITALGLKARAPNKKCDEGLHCEKLRA